MQISLKALICKEDTYLVLLRSNKHPTYPGHWDFPGGRLEEGESKIDGLQREVREETNLEIVVDDKLFVYEMLVEKKLTKFFVYRTKKYSGNIQLSEDHSDYRWVARDELERLNLFPYMYECIKLL